VEARPSRHGGYVKYLLTLLLLIPNLAFASCKYDDFNRVQRMTGVSVHCDYSPNTYFTPYLRSQCNVLSAQNPQFANTEYLSYTIMRFINSYPKEIIQKYLDNIYLLSNLQCDDMQMGGTCSDKSIYVTIYTYTSTQWLVEALHHEFSSILWRYNKLYMTKADIGMISGYAAYDPNSLNNCLSKGTCRKETDELLKQGFLVGYNKTNIENDLNVYAEYLFTNKEHLESLARKYPLVNQKVKLFKKFYADIGIPL